MINKKIIFKIIGFLLFIESAMLLVCAGVSLLYREQDLRDFLFTAGITAATGGLLSYFGKGAERSIKRRDGYIIVTVAWIVFSAFGMLPFYLNDHIPTFTNAFFETMSGFTTTGASILDDIEALPHGLLFWRSLTQWIGGLGIVFFTIAILPVFGAGGIQVFSAESANPTYDKTHPRIGMTARWVWSIYLGITIIQVILLNMGEMNLFDSICHSLTTTGTGGYSTKQASIAYYNSSYIEYVITLFMALSGINFTLLIFFLKGRFKKIAENVELKWYITSMCCFTALITAILLYSSNFGIEESFRNALFQVVSLHTSTGFFTSDYMTWVPVTWGLIFIIMISGACAGSTSGGVKCIRLVILSKIARNELKRFIHPNAVIPVRINNHVIPQTVKATVFSFAFFFGFIALVGWLFFLALGVGFVESAGIVISSMSNMGPGLGVFGPAYSWNSLPEMGKWLACFLMLIGRLEIFTILLLFTKGFWKKN